jgi:hypothetical protein
MRDAPLPAHLDTAGLNQTSLKARRADGAAVTVEPPNMPILKVWSELLKYENEHAPSLASNPVKAPKGLVHRHARAPTVRSAINSAIRQGAFIPIAPPKV